MAIANQPLLIRNKLLDRMRDARDRSDEMFSLVREDSICDRPVAERHRLIFYIGHLEAFDWNLLSQRVLSEKSFHPEFDRLFAFGIDPVSGGLPTDLPADWPRREVVDDYVHKARTILDRQLDTILSPGLKPNSQLNILLNVAIEHRLMHVETLAYLLHQLPYEKKVRRRATLQIVTPPVTPRMIEIPAGSATLGLPRITNQFGWDNEFEVHTIAVPAFEIDEFMVTNRQYLDFIQAGGYHARELWTGSDWEWISSQQIAHPVFWTKSGNQWLYRAMFEKIPLPLDWPVYVSHAEASAYAKWAGKFLPTEAEWHRAAYGMDDGERRYPWGSECPAPQFCNADFEYWDPGPVNALLAGQSFFGIQGMVGNGWEWTSTKFAAFPGFEPFSFYRGYSADFFDGKHFVMKGGSPRTAASMLRPSFRNWFQPHYQYAYAGLRCVRR